MNRPPVSSLQVPTVVVVGGGFAGAMTAVHLLRQAKSPLVVHLIEKTDRLAQGTAYATPSWEHLLNVPAARMGAVDGPEHFHQWAVEHPEALPPGAPTLSPLDFAPRRTFGTYLRSVFESAVQAKPAHVTFLRHHDEATDLSVKDGAVLVTLASGQKLEADRVVLALGNFPPRPVLPADSPVFASGRYVNDPWMPGAVDAVADDPAPALLVGTGLTMVDVALSLRERRPRKTMVALSRRGYLPQVHRLGAPYSTPLPETLPDTVRGLLHWMREETRAGALQGFSWHAVLDALRPHTQTLWRSLSQAERQRFLRHARIHWDVHRHRIAPEIADKLAAMRAGKNLTVVAGRIERIESADTGLLVTYRPRGATAAKTLTVGHVVNCTGPDARWAPEASALVASLRRQELLRPHPVGVGLDVDGEGRVFQRDGSLSPYLFAVGPARQGTLWESVAVPELRDQAPAMAAEVLRSLADPEAPRKPGEFFTRPVDLRPLTSGN